MGHGDRLCAAMTAGQRASLRHFPVHVHWKLAVITGSMVTHDFSLYPFAFFVDADWIESNDP